ncbi:MAG: HEPN domain-containing protein [Nitrospirae bacterium]|nr:HEPN domain-containing protein [Nitrospirota bacterium]MBF0591692.1 HEPN domain-containing protein [Nitrospirota bacterium]
MNTFKLNTVRAWFKKADNDLQAAEMAFTMEVPLYEIACFHAQQCAEKYLKGFLLYNEVDFPKTHSIEYLVATSKPFAPEIQLMLGDIEILSAYAVEIRYPVDDSLYEIPSERAKEAIDLARKVKSTIIAIMDDQPHL